MSRCYLRKIKFQSQQILTRKQSWYVQVYLIIAPDSLQFHHKHLVSLSIIHFWKILPSPLYENSNPFVPCWFIESNHLDLCSNS